MDVVNDKIIRSLIMFFCLLLVMHSNSICQSFAARVLGENSAPGGGQGKAGVKGDQTRRGGTWTGNDSPPGNLLSPAPTSASTISYASNRGNQPRKSCSQSNKTMASGAHVRMKSCASASGNAGSSNASASTSVRVSP